MEKRCPRKKSGSIATTICDQQDALEAARRCYDEHVAASSTQLAQLTRSHEARLANELRQAKTHVDVASERVQASKANAQLILHEQTQRSEILISELRQALKAITDQDVANTRAAAEMEVLLRKELLETKHHLAGLERAWDIFIAKHNEEEELKIRNNVVEQRWWRNLQSVEIEDSKMRQIVSSYEW